MTEVLTYSNWEESRVKALQEEMKGFMDILKWTFREYGHKVIYACSFGAEGMVLLDLISKVEKKANIIFLDTDFHFAETYELINQVKEKYPDFSIGVSKPKLTVDEQAIQYGEKLWESNSNLCCHLRKIEPLTEQLSSCEAWISGLRREQSATRRHVEYINKDVKFQKIKICPLIHWTWEDIWNYIKLNHLPYNKLHDKGYPSIGCENCTLPVAEGQDMRGGRWANSQKTECGLHRI
jgi:phosphoadenosine phosphosulfate reductase